MLLQYTVVPLPASWPGPKVTPRRSPFKTRWTATLDLLAREIRHLGGSRVEIAVDVRGPRDINLNGTLRADARPAARVIVSFQTRDAKRLSFPCGTFAFWQDNVYAIAKALEALRMVERYGVSSTSQYEGFKALPAAGQSTPTMDVVTASRLLASYHPTANSDEVMASPVAAKEAIRFARAKTHPDANNGDVSLWTNVEMAMQVIRAHFREAL